MSIDAEWTQGNRPSALRLGTRARPAAGSEPRRAPQGRRGRLSLQARSLIASSLALFAFLGLTGFALDRAFYESSLKELSYRLRSHVFAYLKDTDVSVSGKIIPPEFPPDSRFDRPQSGLYAAIVADGGNWTSPSALAHPLPYLTDLKPGEERFSGPIETELGTVFVYSIGVLLPWSDRGAAKDMLVRIHVAEHESALNAQLDVFRRTLWAWLVGLGVVLLLLDLLLLRWSLTPLRRVANDLARVERGDQERLEGSYPGELDGLTRSLNDFIESEREQRSRYRNTLADLAHSLKTPLAVMRSEIDDGGHGDALRATVEEQLRRMDEIVAYQLSRAATAGHKTFAAAIGIERLAEEIVQSLEKVHADKYVLCEFEIDPEARFYGEQGDLMELLGNLLENAFKWARERVLLTVHRTGPIGARRRGLEIVVEDDGPGIPEDQVERMLQRGQRGDERVQGHGIGLSIVRDIVRAYRGELVVARSPAFGGAAFTLRFGALD
ncbi:MAG TPA: ATP-binding protein [Candidatus Saccharimonadia bacterium]|nr:ATP-binding protein [Candidatus Saccharimonadia bacterium]